MRRLAAVVLLVALVAPAGAACKETERLQIQIATLQAQVADLRRAARTARKS